MRADITDNRHMPTYVPFHLPIYVSLYSYYHPIATASLYALSKIRVILLFRLSESFGFNSIYTFLNSGALPW